MSEPQQAQANQTAVKERTLVQFALTGVAEPHSTALQCARHYGMRGGTHEKPERSGLASRIRSRRDEFSAALSIE
ncbi:hypothetical protein ANO11243_078700 [Dothideomycetidae sp. 11243]|nr:hypothetical protein ANO11243_078700 [fungal sp. No.11243]